MRQKERIREREERENESRRLYAEVTDNLNKLSVEQVKTGKFCKH